MGAGYDIVNFTRRERLNTVRIGGMKAREMARDHASASLVVWYFLLRRGDQIALVSDYDIESHRAFFGIVPTYEQLNGFRDVTEEVIAHAVKALLLTDHGEEPMCEDDPDLTLRLIRVNMNPGPLPPDGL